MIEKETAVPTKLVREAASVVLVRDGLDGLEVYMLKRLGRGVFPDLHVFPGGKVEDEDSGLTPHLAPPQSANHPLPQFKAAAIRECFEECGVLFAHRTADPLSAAEQRIFRHDVLAGEESFTAGIDRLKLVLQDDAVVYFSHWITPEFAPARFDTRFFVAPIHNEQEADNHERESVAGTWQTPECALRQFALQEWQMIVPTLTTLRMIAGYADVATLMSVVKVGAHRIPVTQDLHERGMQYFVGPWCSR